MNNVQISINGQTFPLHYEIVLKIARNLPEAEYYRELARALVTLGLPSITTKVLYLLEQQDLDKLWAAGNPEIRRSLADKYGFVENLTDAQAQDILDSDDPDLLVALAKRTKLLDPARTERHEGRLSGAMAEALIQRITSSRHEEVLKVREYWVTPPEFLPTFRESVEMGFNLRHVYSKMQPEDIELLSRLTMEDLKWIACRAESIENETARQDVINLLCDHPNPSVRFHLAVNENIPKPILLRLASDAEPDVRWVAQRSLQRLDA